MKSIFVTTAVREKASWRLCGRWNNNQILTASWLCENSDEAIGKATKQSEEMFPSECGWRTSSVTFHRISDYYIREAYKASNRALSRPEISHKH